MITILITSGHFFCFLLLLCFIILSLHGFPGDWTHNPLAVWRQLLTTAPPFYQLKTSVVITQQTSGGFWWDVFIWHKWLSSSLKIQFARGIKTKTAELRPSILLSALPPLQKAHYLAPGSTSVRPECLPKVHSICPHLTEPKLLFKSLGKFSSKRRARAKARY